MLSRASRIANVGARAAAVVARRSTTAVSRSATAAARPHIAVARAMSTAAHGKTDISEVYGCNSFNRAAQRKYLSKSSFDDITATIDAKKPLSPAQADTFADALRVWALERGATHFAHWFQPLTSGIALKHDSFLKRDGEDVINNFNGKMLVKGEPDGSSFPNGGLRNTHIARGYTVWDPSSPCFVVEHDNGATLCLPSVFFSWEGNALDEKTPLLRSEQALEREGLELLKALGETKHKSLHAESGVEQEFFIIEQDYYRARPDLMQTGRTVQGAAPPKGQSLDDQYFGQFSDRYLEALNDAEIEMWKLGIPQTTRHREVAPGQYEMAPWFAPGNQAGDANMLQMDVLVRTLEKHGLAVLFHEKPFAGVNGSGKHNNWSIGTNQIPTLFAPGNDPANNLLFMMTLAATVRAIHKHGDVLRAAVGSASNDHRLGANEAPPAIMSAYLGTDISDAVAEFLGEEVPQRSLPSGNLGINVLPEFKFDNVDRNRTSPFAFTGNKFEFRAVGSSHNPSRSNIFLNTAVCDAMREMTEAIKARVPEGASRAQLREAGTAVIQEVLRESRAAVFDGDNYSEEWHAEAERRGLLNLRTTVDAIDYFDSQKNVDLFAKFGVLSEAELKARIEVMREEYVTKVGNEARSLLSLIGTAILPAAYDIQTKIAGSVLAVQSAGVSGAASHQVNYLNHVVGTIDNLNAATEALKKVLDDSPHDLAEEARYHDSVVLPAMLEARAYADELEGLSAADSWVLPTYHEMLFNQS